MTSAAQPATGYRLPTTALEVELQGELHNARVAGKRRDAGDGGAGAVALRQAELGRIRGVEVLPAELQAAPFAEVIERARDREVEILQSGAVQRVAPAGAEPSRRRHRIRIRVEPQVGAAQ